VRALTERGITVEPADLDVDTTVPVGSGLSSSSALAVALTLALGGAALDGDGLDRVEAAARRVSRGDRGHRRAGGIMDQLASLFGQAGHALLIDCRATSVVPVAIPSSIAVLVVHCGVAPHPRGLRVCSSTGRVMKRFAASLGLAALRDATPEQVRDSPRARHVVAENARVLATADALPAR